MRQKQKTSITEKTKTLYYREKTKTPIIEDIKNKKPLSHRRKQKKLSNRETTEIFDRY